MQSHKPSLNALQTLTSCLRRKSECAVALKITLLVVRPTELIFVALTVSFMYLCYR